MTFNCFQVHFRVSELTFCTERVGSGHFSWPACRACRGKQRAVRKTADVCLMRETLRKPEVGMLIHRVQRVKNVFFFMSSILLETATPPPLPPTRCASSFCRGQRWLPQKLKHAAFSSLARIPPASLLPHNSLERVAKRPSLSFNAHELQRSYQCTHFE